MLITTVGRAYVQTDEFLDALVDAIRHSTAKDEVGRQAFTIWLIVAEMCSLPADYVPSKEELNGFIAMHSQEVMDTAADCTARLEARMSRTN